MTPDSARCMAQYNQWFNTKLYRAASQLPEVDYYLDRQLYFGSIHKTLNHLLLADRIWLGRFTGVPYHAERLDQVLYADLKTLGEARTQTDRQIIDWAAGLTRTHLEGDLRYTSIVTREEKRGPLWEFVLHFFNHQTHHRGQVTAALSQAGLDYGVTDLIGMPQGNAR